MFTLGQATKEDLDNIQDKKIYLLKLKEEQITQKKTLETQQNKLKNNADTLTDDCWVIYKQYEVDFKEVSNILKSEITKQFEMIIEDVKLAMQEKFMLEKFNKEQSGKKDNFDDSLSIG